MAADPIRRESGDQWSRQVEGQERRRLRARRAPDQGVWFGLGMFGLVGWSVAIPTLLGLGLGIFLDAHFQSRRSWTLVCLVAGVVLGCVNAWYWVQKEGRDQS